jgi:carboxyl-terminal processing protease
MHDNGALILSIAKYYSPGGKSIQDVAVTPNVVVADVQDDAGLPDDEASTAPAEDKNAKPKNPQDEQLNKALEVLKNRESKG